MEVSKSFDDRKDNIRNFGPKYSVLLCPCFTLAGGGRIICIEISSKNLRGNQLSGLLPVQRHIQLTCHKHSHSPEEQETMSRIVTQSSKLFSSASYE